jgi:hypothetical protein
MLVRQAMIPVGIGLSSGSRGGCGIHARDLDHALWRQRHDVAIFAGVPLLLALAGLAASLIPAYRATRVDPLICLRTEYAYTHPP